MKQHNQSPLVSEGDGPKGGGKAPIDRPKEDADDRRKDDDRKMREPGRANIVAPGDD